MNILIGGDLVPTKSNQDIFKKGEIYKLLGKKLYNKWFNANFRIFNLETPLINKKTPIKKNGAILSTSVKTINGLKNLKPSLVSLANNHIMDHDFKGYNSTIKNLNKYNIPFVGSGYNIKQAKKPYILNYENKQIGVYSCAEYEFSIAKKSKAGANPFDPLESLDHINRLSKNSDFVIVLYHGGKEHYRYPSPNLQYKCRKMTEKGADLIVCQHSHCIGSFEKYNNSTIIYGQGNFIFNMKDNKYWNTGMLVNLIIENNKYEVNFIPFKTNNYGIETLNKENKKNILKNFYKRSEKIKDPEFVKEKYENFANEKILHYLRKFSGLGKWFSRIDRFIFNGFLTKKLFNTKKILKLLNYIQCEAHRELIISGLKNIITNDKKNN